MPSAVFKTVLTVLMFFICLLHWILYSALAQGLPRLKSAVEIGSLSRGFSCVFTFTRLWAIAASKILRWVIRSLLAALWHGQHVLNTFLCYILLLAPRLPWPSPLLSPSLVGSFSSLFAVPTPRPSSFSSHTLLSLRVVQVEAGPTHPPPHQCQSHRPRP